MGIQYEDWSKRTVLNFIIFLSGYALIIGCQYIYQQDLFDWSIKEIER